MPFIRHWKKFIALALVGLLSSWLISCGSGDSTAASSDGKAEVEFWTMQLSPDFDEYFNQLIAEFETENPDIAIKWQDIPWGDMETKIRNDNGINIISWILYLQQALSMEGQFLTHKWKQQPPNNKQHYTYDSVADRTKRKG